MWVIHLSGLFAITWGMMWAFTMGHIGAGIILSICWLGVFYLAASDEVPLPKRRRGGHMPIRHPRPSEVLVRLDNGDAEAGESNMTESKEG